MDITKIDKNLAVKPVNENGIIYYDSLDEPFVTYGVFHNGEKYMRMPADIAKNVNGGVFRINYNTAGGRVRFRTNSKRIVISADMDSEYFSAFFALTGSAGFDLYDGNAPMKYLGTFMRDTSDKNGYQSEIVLEDANEKELVINFPPYSNVKKLWIGLECGASLSSPKEYKIKKPVVFYGSSITQGACSSRPGCSYESILSQKLDFDYINLGFSGSARGESSIAEYISSLEMSAFVMDYDHNAPSPEHLRDTHGEFFKIIRTENPDLPILVLSRPKYSLMPDELLQCDIIRKTVEEALADGDRNVEFISGPELMSLTEDNGTVDNCHPTDAGFLSMAMAIEPKLRKMLSV